MKEKIIKSIIRFLLMWLLVILIFIALCVIIWIPILIFNHFGNGTLGGVLLFLYITFLVTGMVVSVHCANNS